MIDRGELADIQMVYESMPLMEVFRSMYNPWLIISVVLLTMSCSFLIIVLFIFKADIDRKFDELMEHLEQNN